jgi:hypothetical protein
MDNRNEISHRWRYSAGEIFAVWQLMFTGGGGIIGQKRSREKRHSLFFSLEEHSGRSFFDDYLLLEKGSGQPVGDSWFTGIETISGQLVFLHSWQQHSPEHQGLWAVSADNGSLVWARPEIVFCGMLDDGLLVYLPTVFAGFPERRYLILDPMTGSERLRLGEDEKAVSEVRASIVPEIRRQGVLLPEIAVPGGNNYEIFRAAGITVSMHCESLSIGSITAAAVHDSDTATGTWRSLLRIWRTEELVYEDLIAEKTSHPAVNGFLVHGGSLYYIKGESELIALDL